MTALERDDDYSPRIPRDAPDVQPPRCINRHCLATAKDHGRLHRLVEDAAAAFHELGHHELGDHFQRESDFA